MPLTSPVYSEMLSDSAVKPTIAVWFSCGAASAIAARIAVKYFGKSCNIRIMNTPVKEEHEDNRRFLHDVEDWLGQKIEIVTEKDHPESSCVDVWAETNFMSSVHGAKCTTVLKRKARQQWENKNHHDYLVLGFTADEQARHDRFSLTERSNVLPLLIDMGFTKNDCFRHLAEVGIKLPEIYALGYANANCIGCVKATSPTYWNHVRKTHPLTFKARAEQSRLIGCKLVRVNNKRIYLDELSPFDKGLPLLPSPDCSLFCEEIS